MKRPGIFIQTNAKQAIGAIVSAYSMTRNSAHADDFDVTIMHQEDYPFFQAREGETFMRHGVKRVWRNSDLQSFTLVRFLPPQLMNYEGRAVVVDPDVFAIGDVWELLSRDMGDNAIMCRQLKFRRHGYATSVMLLDCAKLRHWNVERGFNDLFEMKRDYHDWISLKLEPPGSIGLIEPEWNDFDRLTPATKMVHNTRRRTQPWKTGLPVDYTPTELFPVLGWLMRARRKLFGDYGLLGRYARHPDPSQENLFFGLLRECLEKGLVSEAEIKDAMSHNYVRHDSFEVIAKVPRLKTAA
ncbi:MAG: hypothetical protein HY245_14500 [Rhizobiales bacterium]|nr:hypothetical protein [Hyphomicrobiales bacterium]MBI3674602.1 hypothetical protein [Hyphomicrobiales bacterium]